MEDNFLLFDKYPHYIFNFSGSNRYRFMKEYFPKDFGRLKQDVAQGRWFPVGSSVEEGDVNAPSAEAIIRQILYGNEWFREEFGKTSEEYMLPDCFGFPSSLPDHSGALWHQGFFDPEADLGIFSECWRSAIDREDTLARLTARMPLQSGTKIADIDISRGTNFNWQARRLQNQVQPVIPVELFGTVEQPLKVAQHHDMLLL
jgi:hypothetical protein